MCEEHVIIGLRRGERKVVEIGRCIDSTTPRPPHETSWWKPVKEITNYYRRRFIEKNWFVLGIAEGDPYRGSLEAPHSGPSLRRIEVYELSMPWFQRRETLQFLPGFVSVRTNTTVSSRWKLILTTNISYFSFEKFPLARI